MSEPALLADLGHAAARLSHVSPPLLLTGLAFQALGLLLRSAAWRNILRATYPDRPVPYRSVAAAYVAGVAANGVLPAKGGEIAKVTLARASIERSSAPAIVTSLGVLSLFDAVVGVSITLGLLATGSVPGLRPAQLVPHPSWLLAAAAVAAACLLGAIGFAATGLRTGLRAAARNAISSLTILRSPMQYLRTVASIQAAAWACRLAVAACLLAAFGLRPTLASAATVVVIGGLAGLVPGSPGGLGAQQVILAYALGTTAATANIVAFSLGMQLSVVLLQAVLGLIALMLMARVAHPLRAIQTLRGAVAAGTGS
ncbi:MAG: lysylphosphatidylglycerol synthase domain-containing protein [Gaiellales bacterium]